MTEALLPEAFEDLAPWLDWALEPERARAAKKVASSMEEIGAFYDAMMPRMEEIIAYLDGVPDGDERPERRRTASTCCHCRWLRSPTSWRSTNAARSSRPATPCTSTRSTEGASRGVQP